MAFFRRSSERRAERGRRSAEKAARKAEKKAVAEAHSRLRVEKAEARLATDRARAHLRLQRLAAKLKTTEAREELREKRDVRVLGSRREKAARIARGATFFGGSASPVGFKTHTEAHASPSHHIGSCDGTCRKGQRPHRHNVLKGVF